MTIDDDATWASASPTGPRSIAQQPVPLEAETEFATNINTAREAYRTNNVSDFGHWRRPAPIFYGKSHPNRLSHSDKKCVPLLTFSQVA